MHELELRIIKWNKERGLLDRFDPNLEIKMLSEEAAECIEADNLPHTLQEYCDFLFVWFGTLAKYNSIKHRSVSTFQINFENFKNLDKWATKTSEYLYRLLENKYIDKHYTNLDSDIKLALGYICDANDKKGKKKNADGKVVKGADHVDPLVRIKQMFGEGM